MEVASRKVMVSPEVMEAWTTFRDEKGWPVTITWGQPDEDGWYNPFFTKGPCDHEFLREGDWCAICGVGL